MIPLTREELDQEWSRLMDAANKELEWMFAYMVVMLSTGASIGLLVPEKKGLYIVPGLFAIQVFRKLKESLGLDKKRGEIQKQRDALTESR